MSDIPDDRSAYTHGRVEYRARHPHPNRGKIMGIAVSAARTMAGAKRIVADNDVGRLTPRRRRLIEQAQRWNAMQAQAIKKRAEAERQHELAIARQVEEWRRRTAKGLRTPHQTIIGQVAAWHDVPAAEILGRSRFKEVVLARHDAIAAVYTNCHRQGRQMSLPEVGRVFGVDHTSVLYALRKLGVVEA